MPNVFDQIRMLPREVPRDSFHESIVNALVNGVDQQSVVPLFDLPGIGFHRALFTLTLFLAEYRTQGRQTFVVPSVMQEALARTSLEDVRFDDLRLPFRCLYMALPDCEAKIWGGDGTRWHNVGGVFIRHVAAGEGTIQDSGGVRVCPEGMINVYIWGMENERSQGPGDDASMWFTFDLAELKTMDLESYLLMMLNDPERDASLSEMTDFGRSLNLSTEFPRHGDRHKPAVEGVLHVMRVVFNALLYMDCQDAEITPDESMAETQQRRQEIETALGRMKNPNKSRARKLRKQLDTLPTDVVSWVGRSVRIRGTETNANPGTGTPQRVHWVRGHWWPRRDTIANRIRDAKVEANAAREEYESCREHTASLTTSEDIARSLPVLAAAKRAALHADTVLHEITEGMNAKRRWVKPYKKGTRGSLPDSHTYVLNGSTDALKGGTT